MGNEQNTKELQLSDLRSKLNKRQEELAALKEGLNSQIQQVHEQFENEIKEQAETIKSQGNQIGTLQVQLKEQVQLRSEREEETRDIKQTLERQREVLRQNGQELVETQSKAADLEDRLTQTENMLISVKASWAEAEHEREVLKSKMHTLDEVL